MFQACVITDDIQILCLLLSFIVNKKTINVVLKYKPLLLEDLISFKTNTLFTCK
jgi:hypothetical protein